MLVDFYHSYTSEPPDQWAYSNNTLEIKDIA